MLKLILGRAGRGKTAHILNQIKECAAAKEKGQILIVPEQYSHAAERELCLVCGDSVSLYGEVLSFSRLAGKVAAELGGQQAGVLDSGGRILTMRLAVSAVQSELRGYRFSRKTRQLEALVRILEEMKSCMITPEMLADASEKAEGTLKNKLRDLSLICGAYDAVSRGRDPGDKITRLAREIDRSQIGEEGHIYIDGFTDFTAQEFAVIAALMAKGADMTVALTAPGLTEETEVFESARKTAAALKNEAVAAGIGVVIETAEGEMDLRPPELAFLEKNLFAEGIAVFEGEQDAVEIISAKNPVEECELAASKVCELVCEKGYRYRDIAVVARGFGDYETAAENIFANNRVPVYMSRKADIMQKPIMLLVTSALEIIAEGWRYEAVFRYLKTGLSGIGMEECDVLENYVLKWNISGSMWQREDAWTENPRGYDREMGEPEHELLAKINLIRRRVAGPLVRLRDRGKKAETAAGQVVALYDFMEDIGLPERLGEKARRFKTEGDTQSAAEYSQIWGILIRAIEQCGDILGDCPMELAEFWELFQLTLSQYDVGTIPVSLDAVPMGDLGRMRSRNVKCLIVMGAGDDRMPAALEDTGLLTDDERGILRELGISLAESAEEKLYREMNLIYNAFTMASERLFVMYPQQGGDREGKRPSFIVSRIVQMFGIETDSTGEEGLRRVWSVEACFDLAVKSGQNPRGAGVAAARAYFEKDHSAGGRLSAVLERAGAARGRLSEEAAQRLYGEKLYLSASRVDSYASCRFRYFMQYGLRAKPRKRAEFDAPAAGIFMHYILENVTREINNTGGFSAVEDAYWKKLVKKYADIYIREQLRDFKDKTDRFRYLFKRLLRDTYRVALDMVRELERSDFKPLDFELRFGGDFADMPPVELAGDCVELSLNGAVDRVDGWIRDGKLYLRVVDYKTGKKGFKLSDIWYGMGMQMLIYLFALGKNGRERYGGMEIVPAGVLYAPARDVMVAAPPSCTDEEIERLRLDKLKRSGLLISDPEVLRAMEKEDPALFIPVKFGKDGEIKGDSVATVSQMGHLGRHIEKTLLEIGRELKSGSIAAEPCFGSVGSPCDYCDYKSACQFDENRDRRRYLPKLEDKEVLARVSAEPEADGGSENGGN